MNELDIFTYHASIFLYMFGWVTLRMPIFRYTFKLIPVLFFTYHLDNKKNEKLIYVGYALGDFFLLFDDINPIFFSLGVISFSFAHIVYFFIHLFPSNNENFHTRETFFKLACFLLPFLHLILYVHLWDPLVICAYYAELLFIIWIQIPLWTHEFYAFSIFIVSDLLLLINMLLPMSSFIVEAASIGLYWISIAYHFDILN